MAAGRHRYKPLSDPHPMDTSTIYPPIREQTATRLRELLGHPSVTNHQLQRVILADPGLALLLYREVGPRATEPIASIGHALSLAGITTLEQLLSGARRDDGEAYARLCSRATHSAHLASAWAKRELQSNDDEVLTAAVLQHAIETLTTDYAPIALEDGVTSRATLAERLQFPYLSQDCAALTGLLIPRARTVQLAVELARLSAIGWYRDDTLEMLDHIASHLHLDLDRAIAESHCVAVDCAHESTGHGLPLSAFELAGIPSDEEAESNDEETPSLHIEVMKALHAMHDELGLQRILFALLAPQRDTLRARFVLGTADDDPMRQGELPLNGKTLFDILMRKPQAVWVNPDNAVGYRRYLPPLPWLNRDEFVAVSLFVANRPVGLFLADGWPDHLSREQKRQRFARFQALCQRVSDHLAAHADVAA